MPGKVLTDKAATLGHTQDTSICAPFTRSDAASLAMRVGKDVSALLWTHPGYHHKSLFAIDPNMKFKALRILSSKLEAMIHQLRLGLAYTQKYLHRIGTGQTLLTPLPVKLQTLSIMSFVVVSRTAIIERLFGPVYGAMI